MDAAQYRLRGTTASEIAASAEEGVRLGALPPGALVPTVRALAADLRVAPGTVAAAYRILRDRGLLVTDGRRGTRVRPRPTVLPRAAAAVSVPPGTVDLSRGHPDPALLPPIGEAMARAARRAGVAAPPAEPVLPRLRRAAQQRLAADGVPADALTLTSGALDAYERVLAATLRPGDAVAVEDPGWPGALDLLGALGLRADPVAVDEQGPRPERLAAALRAGARAVLVTSRAQNPTGAAVTATRASELREVLRSSPDVLLVEDDHSADLADVPLSPLSGATRSWVFVRSLSKPYGPDLRLALVVGDPVTTSRVEGRLRLGPGWVSNVLQELAVELWQDEPTARAVARAARTYDLRRKRLLAALQASGCAATAPSGINVWIPLPDESSAVAQLLTAGWLVAPGSRFRLRSDPALRVSLGGLPDDHIDDVAKAVARAAKAPRADIYSV